MLDHKVTAVADISVAQPIRERFLEEDIAFEIRYAEQWLPEKLIRKAIRLNQERNLEIFVREQDSQRAAEIVAEEFARLNPNASL